MRLFSTQIRCFQNEDTLLISKIQEQKELTRKSIELLKLKHTQFKKWIESGYIDRKKSNELHAEYKLTCEKLEALDLLHYKL
ncbi:MAG: hypothetical protein OEL54_01670 [Flavobacteriaceae bacterium]|nr:hypothetical protein [Flavobacteriaceae bacterium]